MRKIKVDFDVFFDPKEAWFLSPLIMVERSCESVAICFGFLCFGIAVAFCKEDE